MQNYNEHYVFIDKRPLFSIKLWKLVIDSQYLEMIYGQLAEQEQQGRKHVTVSVGCRSKKGLLISESFVGSEGRNTCDFFLVGRTEGTVKKLHYWERA